MKKEKVFFRKQTIIGDWDLEKFGIWDLFVPKSRIQTVDNGAYGSGGVYSKFTVIHGKLGELFVKTGKHHGGTYFSNNEPIAEHIASDIGSELGFDVAPYILAIVDMNLFLSEEQEFIDVTDVPKGLSFNKSLRMAGKVLASVSQSFLDAGEQLYSCRALHGNDLEGPDLHEDICKAHDFMGRKAIDQMIMFDYIVHNTDRHHQNFGFIKDQDGLVRPAPLYDHSLSLLAEHPIEAIREDEMDVCGYVRGKPFGSLLGALGLVHLHSAAGLEISKDSQLFLTRLTAFKGCLRMRGLK